METNPPLQGENPVTPYQESQRTCTRNSPCRLQGCMICCTPTNHVRNLEGELSSSEAITPSPTDDDLPQPPHDHFLQGITLKYKQAIQKQDLPMLEALNSKCIQYISNNEDYFFYNVSDLETYRDTAIDLLNISNYPPSLKNLERDPITPLQQDGDTSATPHQEPQKTCPRISPCIQQGYKFGATPTNITCNPYVITNSRNASPTSSNSVDRPQLPANHPILFLTSEFQRAVQGNNIHELEAIDKMYTNYMAQELKFLLYDPNLNATYQTTMNLLNSRFQPPVNHLNLILNASFQHTGYTGIYYGSELESFGRSFLISKISTLDIFLYDCSNLYEIRHTTMNILNFLELTPIFPINPVLPNNPVPPTKLNPPARPNCPINPDPPTKPNLSIEPSPPINLEPPTEPDPSTNPDSPNKPNPPVEPGPPINLEPPTEPDPSTNPASPPKPDPPSNPNPPIAPGPSTGPDPPIKPDWPTNPDPPTNLDPPINPDSPSNPDPQINPDPPTKPDPSTKPNPPLEPDPSTDPDPLTNSDLPIKPDPPTNPDPPIEPGPPTNLGPSAETDPHIDPDPSTQSDPLTKPNPTPEPDPPTKPDLSTEPDPPFEPDPSTNTVPPLNSDPPIDPVQHLFLRWETALNLSQNEPSTGNRNSARSGSRQILLGNF